MTDQPGADAKKTARQQRKCSRQNVAASEPSPHFTDAPNGLLGMAADIASLFGSFEIMAGDPANFSLRQNVIRHAQGIAAQFKQASARLQGVEYGLNTSIQKDVVRANYHLHDIAAFNEQIVDTLAVGGDADAWCDQRAKCLDALSCCANLTVTPQPDGGLNVSIGGITMVAGGTKPDCLATYPDTRGNLCLQAQNSGARLKLICGSIARKIEARDGRLAELQKGLNSLAAQLIARVNANYNAGCGTVDEPCNAFFHGKDASDIGVNSALAGNPAQLQTGVATEETGSRMVALALARLGAGKMFNREQKNGKERNGIQANPELEEALAMINDSFNAGNEASQQQALDSTLDGETASFMRYQQACASSAKVFNTLDEMAPMH
jgi:flagellar hook-associated protein FlgK